MNYGALPIRSVSSSALNLNGKVFYVPKMKMSAVLLRRDAKPQRCKMDNQAKASLFDLYPKDRECLERIKQRLEIDSNALAVRLAIRELARRLSQPEQLAGDTNTQRVADLGEKQ
jgi:hypothetical protein